MSELADFEELEARLGALARELADDDRRLEEPPVDLWASIEAQAMPVASVTSLDSRRRWRSMPVILAAAAALLLGVVVGAQFLGGDEADSRLVASVDLVNDGLQVPNPDHGMAELIEEDGSYVLDVDVPDLPPADGYYELWVIDTDVAGMFSLGEVDGSGRYELPPGVEPGEFPVVDISVEAHDGDAAHGGQSIWRGVLDV